MSSNNVVRRRSWLSRVGWAVMVLVALAASVPGGAVPEAAAAAPPGTAFAWGSNANCELGIGCPGDTTSSNVACQPPSAGAGCPARSQSPVVPSLSLPAGEAVTSVSAGGPQGFGLALTSSGRVFAWGNNSYRQLGIPGAGKAVGTPSPVGFPNGTVITAIAAGSYHSLALTSTGQVLAWGDNSSGQLGIAAPGSSPNMTLVQLPPNTRVTGIAAGALHSLAMTSDGRVLSWGDNSRSQLGRAAAGLPSSLGSVNLPSGVTVVSVAAGDWHSLAVTSAGKVLAWGDNIFGQLGYPTTTDTATSGTPSFTQSGGGGDLSGIRAVAGGMAHSVALTSGGAVLSWGDDHYGQLGLGSSTGWTQTPRPASLPANTLIGSVAAGGRSTLAVTSAGNVLAWGDNFFDQLGYPTTPISDFLNYSPTPTQVPGLSSISTASMGQVHALAVTGGLAAARTYRADASAVYVENLVLNGMRVPDGGAGLCEAGPVTTHVDESHAGVGACSGLASMLTQLGVGISVSTAPAQLVAEAVDVRGTAAPADATVTAESSTALLQVELPGGIPVVARDLRAVTRGSCLSPESGVSSVGRLEVANTVVATQPVGSRIVFNPSAGGAGNIAHVSLHGNPIAFNPTGGRVPAAIVTLNYSRHDPSTNTETTSSAVIEFPARGPFAATIAGRIFLSYTTAGLTGCTN